MGFAEKTDREWRRWGEIDPYYAVLTAPQFHRESLDERARQEFFASGEEHVDHVFVMLHRHVRAHAAPARVLDYGCGVGRLVLAFSSRASQVTGVDIAPAMIEEAQKVLAERGIHNARLLLVADFEANPTECYDLIHSFIVFQHIRARRGEMILQRLLRRLTPGGLGAIHLTFGSSAPPALRVARELRKRFGLLHGGLNLARGKPWSAPLMQMNAYSLNRVFKLLLAEGCVSLHAEFSDHGGCLGVMLYFEKPRSVLAA